MNSINIMSIFGAVSVIFAVAAVSTGVQAIINPAGFATSFGIPLPRPAPKHAKPFKPRATPTAEEAATSSAYIALLGARQLGTGITLLVFAYQGKWIESATILTIIGIVVAGMDGYHIARSGSLGGGLFHAIPGALIAALAAATLHAGR
jgi:hypothetical protein